MTNGDTFNCKKCFHLSKVSFKAIGSHIIHGLIKTKDMKEYEVWNMFHENELMQKIIHKRSGSTYTNLWKRRIQTNLWFKFCRAENLTEFYQELCKFRWFFLLHKRKIISRANFLSGSKESFERYQ